MVIPERFEYEAEMVTMEEMPEEADTVKLILPVCIIESLQVLQLLKTCLVPEEEEEGE